jgi:predicted HAD superfamily hydrolase
MAFVLHNFKGKIRDYGNMESVNIANNYEEAFKEHEQESPLLMQLLMQEEILRSKIRPNRFFKGLIFALPISLFMWSIIIWVIL